MLSGKSCVSIYKKKEMKKLLIALLLGLSVVSCNKFADFPDTEYTFGGGVYVVNEGVFNHGDASLSFWSYDSAKIYNNLFSAANGRPLGDVANSVIIFGDNAYIVVNNSGKIEVVDPETITSKATITGLKSPRNMAVANTTKAYVTSFSSDSIAIIDLLTNSISGKINVKHTTEGIVVLGSRAYVTSWYGGNKIFVISTLNDHVIDSIEVGAEPEGMVIDANLKLWVLCTGGWAKEHFAEIDLINPSYNVVEKKFVFPDIQDSPKSLAIDGLGQNLVYIDNGIKVMNIASSTLPLQPLIPAGGANFYKVAVNPINSDIFVTDAVDYNSRGYLSIYKNDGTFISKLQAGMIPGAMFFRLIINP